MTTNGPPYFSDSELGPPRAVLDELPPVAWAGVVATFNRFADKDYFAADFPDQCPDGGVSGTNRSALRGRLISLVPDLGEWPSEQRQPGTITAMDLVVFGWSHAQEPTVAHHHAFPGHNHYHPFNKQAGRRQWRTEVNQILQRNGVALRQKPNGEVIRIGSVAAGILTQSALPATGDAQLDDKIETALRKYKDPDIAVRREALEALWDAFERVKTVIEPGAKRQSADALVALMVSSTPSREAVSAEFLALTDLGNQFQIRHHEVDRHPVEPAMVDLLFVRALTVVEAAVRAWSINERA